MVLVRILCCCLLGCVLSVPCHAIDDLAVVVATVEQGYGQLTDLQADFVQRAAIAGIKGETKGSGQLSLKKGKEGAPPLFRFDYKKPRQQVVSNGKTVWFYLPDSKQVMVSDLTGQSAAESGAALSMLTGLGSVSRDFSPRLAASGRDAQGNYVLELTPRHASSLFNKMELAVAASAVEAYRTGGKASDPFPVRSSTVFDAGGGRTSMVFSNIRTNRGMDSRRFTFRPPEGVEVIKQ
jgi:outer membrane lipoprotein carrier protein